MKNAIVENSIVTNIIVGELPDSIQCPDEVGIGWEYVNGEWREPTPTEDEVRLERDKLLKSSDVYALPDYPHRDKADKKAWEKYRKELRDIPQQTGFPSTVAWPEKPE